MDDKKWIQALQKIKLPEDKKEELTERCMKKQHCSNIVLRYSGWIAACACLVISMAVGLPTYAAYHLYQIKNMDVFFDSAVTQEQIDEIGETLAQMDGIYSVRFVSGDEAWDTFQNKYFVGEFSSLAHMFEGNPLENSSSYRVTVKLDADEEKVREEIGAIEGVRMVTDLREGDS